MEHQENRDVIVVGAGPSGSICAILLGRMGYNVLLVDKAKFPRDKPCGDGISGKSVSLLKEFGLFEKIPSIEHQICDGATIYLSDEIKVELDDATNTGFTSKRVVYDNFLFEKAKELVDVLEEFSVTDLIIENSKVMGVKGINLKTKEGIICKAKVVVGADGANSVVASKLGLNKFEPKHRASALRVYYKNISAVSKKLELYFLDNIMPGYFWIFPLENGQANVGIGMVVSEMQNRKISLQELMLNEIKTNPLLTERFKDAQMVEGSLRGWNLPLATAKRKMYGNGFVLLGDAASLIDPFTGEGIGNGMLSAKVASIVINEAFKKNDYSEKILEHYDKLLTKEIGKELKASYTLQGIGNFIFRFKWFRNFLYKKVIKRPALISAISASFSYDNTDKPSPLKLLKEFIF